MSIPRLFCPSLTGGRNVIPDDEAHHARQVLRIKIGEEIVLFNGKGSEAQAVVMALDRKKLEVDVTRRSEYPYDAAVQITLAVAMPKAHRQGYLIEKCTELGVFAIWPVETERGVAKPGAAAVEKWKRRAVEAAKQAGRRWVPQIETPQTFDDAMARRGEVDHAVLAQAGRESISLTKHFESVKPSDRVLAFIGPEGGWTPEECGRARDAGLSLVRLAQTVLRTETAAVSFCAAVAARFSES
ncbi:MAG: 16S rRNA (uracil(1498)-N(3))-methyltransferase [Planctomycetes bacterium]|nr:16S rRNA (uracil(1498)-N(3))-methyltransferase [Planctomycetota bacterium]